MLLGLCFHIFDASDINSLMKKILLLFVLLAPLWCFAQTIEWAKTLKTNYSYDENILIECDLDGNIILCGQFSDSLDFDFGPNQFILHSKGYSDVFIAKYTPAAQLLWAKSIGGYGQESVHTLSVDGNNNITIGGNLNRNVDFDPSTNDYLVNSDSTNTFISKNYIAKYNTNGEFNWVVLIGVVGILYDNYFPVLLDHYNQMYLHGIESGPIIITTHNTIDSITDLAASGGTFLIKFDINGNLVKKCVLEEIYVNEMVVTKDNKLLLSGEFRSKAGPKDFDPGPSTYLVGSNSYYEVFAAKYHLNYQPIWVKNIPTASHSTALIHPHTNGDFTLVIDYGHGIQNVSFHPNPPFYVGINSSYGTGIVRYDSAGAVKYGVSILGSPYLLRVMADLNDNTFIAGVFESQIKLNHPDSPLVVFVNTQNNPNYFWAIYSNQGKLLLTSHFVSIRGYKSDFALGMNNEIYFCGSFLNTIDVDPLVNTQHILTETNGGFFIVKYTNTLDAEYHVEPQDDLLIFPNPAKAGSKIFLGSSFQSTAQRIEVFSIHGECIASMKPVEADGFYLPSQIPPGLYLIRVHDTDNKSLNFKLLVE